MILTSAILVAILCAHGLMGGAIFIPDDSRIFPIYIIVVLVLFSIMLFLFFNLRFV